MNRKEKEEYLPEPSRSFATITLEDIDKAYKELMKSDFMKVDREVMNQVRRCSKEFIEKEYPEEALYFDIAWTTYSKALQGNPSAYSGRILTINDLRKPTVRDLRKPTVRLGGSSTIMAPRVIRAFHILFLNQRMESEPDENHKQEMLQLLSQEKFSSEFSTKVVNFFVENGNSK